MIFINRLIAQRSVVVEADATPYEAEATPSEVEVRKPYTDMINHAIRPKA